MTTAFRRPPPGRLALLVAAVAVPPAARLAAQCAGRELAAEAFAGSAWNLPLPLRIELPEGRARIAARYSTRPFADAPYYSFRLGDTRASGRGAEVELLHHKLYLENPEPPVEHFEVTHGYNLPTANMVAPAGAWRLRIGLGMVVAHPEGRIAGRALDGVRTLLGGGYHIAGVTAQLAVGRRYGLGRGRVALTAAPEAKLTVSWARMSMPRGRLVVPNAALHLLGGLGVRRCR